MLSPTSSFEGAGWLASTPTVDVHETDNSYVIEAELPGIKKEDVTMEMVDEHTLRLSGTFKSESEEKGKSFWSKERMRGAFGRSFRFPDTINPDKIHASMNEGLLKVEIEKTEESAQMKVPIKID